MLAPSPVPGYVSRPSHGRVAHLDRVPASEAGGSGFESRRAHSQNPLIPLGISAPRRGRDRRSKEFQFYPEPSGA